jgi:coatomer protein complex subunit alpha (xenin)
MQLTVPATFDKALSKFREILTSTPLLLVNDKNEQTQVDKLINRCLQYIVMLTCDGLKKEAGLAQDKVLDLYLIMALCQTHPSHRMQALRLAINTSFKAECYVVSAFLVRKYLALAEENPGLADADMVAKNKKILQVSEKRGGNKFALAFEEKWLYDDNMVLKISSKNFVVMSADG